MFWKYIFLYDKAVEQLIVLFMWLGCAISNQVLGYTVAVSITN